MIQLNVAFDIIGTAWVLAAVILTTMPVRPPFHKWAGVFLFSVWGGYILGQGAGLWGSFPWVGALGNVGIVAWLLAECTLRLRAEGRL